MKLDELITADDHRDGDSAKATLRDAMPEHLKALPREIASYIAHTGEREEAFAATRAGLYAARPLESDEGWKVEGELIPWSDVSGAGLAFSGFRGAPDMVTVTITNPRFSVSASKRQPEWEALVAFGLVCVKRQRR